MGRNNAKNIKQHNDKLQKAKNKENAKKTSRQEKLKTISRKFNNDQSTNEND